MREVGHWGRRALALLLAKVCMAAVAHGIGVGFLRKEWVLGRGIRGREERVGGRGGSDHERVVRGTRRWRRGDEWIWWRRGRGKRV